MILRGPRARQKNLGGRVIFHGGTQFGQPHLKHPVLFGLIRDVISLSVGEQEVAKFSPPLTDLLLRWCLSLRENRDNGRDTTLRGLPTRAHKTPLTSGTEILSLHGDGQFVESLPTPHTERYIPT